MRLVTENRQGQRCFSYHTFHVSVSGRDSEGIPFSAGKLLSVNGLGHLRGKGMGNLFYKLTIDKMNERRGRKAMTDITYRVEGDYLIPNIILDDEADDSPEEMIGRYGMMRESFLREHKHGTHTAILLMGKPTSHLR